MATCKPSPERLAYTAVGKRNAADRDSERRPASYFLIRLLVLLFFLPAMQSCQQEKPVSEPVAAPAHQPDPLKGLKLYLGYCFVCHGQKGDGNGPYASMLSATPADFTDSTYFKPKTDEELYDFISKGGIAHGKSMHMKPFGFQLTADEIQSTVDYIRVLNRHELLIQDDGFDYSGEEIYANSCVMCHGEKGAGDGRVARMLNLKIRPLTSRTLDQYSPAKLFTIVEQGIPGDTTGSGKYMPGWGESLSEQEISNVIFYLDRFRE